MVIEYSQTINKYTYLDAYSKKRVEKKNQNAEYTVYKIYKVYYQISNKEEKLYTIFEACGNFYQLSWVHFGVAGFQRVIDIENLKDTFAYIDNVTV